MILLLFACFCAHVYAHPYKAFVWFHRRIELQRELCEKRYIYWINAEHQIKMPTFATMMLIMKRKKKHAPSKDSQTISLLFLGKNALSFRQCNA